jgi:hypothetical protein
MAFAKEKNNLVISEYLKKYPADKKNKKNNPEFTRILNQSFSMRFPIKKLRIPAKSANNINFESLR